jgi:hypothetical protein
MQKPKKKDSDLTDDSTQNGQGKMRKTQALMGVYVRIFLVNKQS